jgi:acetolactate synthase-1/2/3 large subunit
MQSEHFRVSLESAWRLRHRCGRRQIETRDETMNGADAILTTLANNGVEACFANPGTSEMHIVAALDRQPTIRPVLCLFEGVATGAADGYGRMAGKPAVTLLHLGPGYTNGAANLHNARRAFTPIVNIIGDHATYHRKHDAPLTSDIEALAAPNSRWIGVATTANHAAQLASEAFRESYGPPGGSSCLILPADCAWSPASETGPVVVQVARQCPESARVEAVAKALSEATQPTVLLGAQACEARGLAVGARLAARGVRVLVDTFVARQPRGHNQFGPGRIPYFAEMAFAELAGTDVLALAGTTRPVPFFAYPDRPNTMIPDACQVLELARRDEDAIAALEALADAMGAASDVVQIVRRVVPDAPTGAISPVTVGASIARHMPEATIISDDGVTSSGPISAQTAQAAPHDWLSLTGGAIGQGLPVAIGAAIACPDRKVIALTGDGAAMYTSQSLWTIARENLDVTVIVFANHAYRILGVELDRTGAGDPGPAARKLLDLGDPRIDWVGFASSMGLPARRCSSAEDFDQVFASAMKQKRPILIEAAIA